MIVFRCSVVLVAMLATAPLRMHAQSARTKYPRMAAVDQYRIADRNAEIALARSAAPAAISNDAEVMVLGKEGYEVAVPGRNHFVCLVERSWDAAIGDPGFWNQKIRGPDCFNEAAVRSFLPIVLMKTHLALSGKSEAEIEGALREAFREKKLPPLEPGAMSFMLSKQGYLADGAGHWHPHLMFFVPVAMSGTWGANLAGSPVISGEDPSDGLTILMVPVARWSDGTMDLNAGR
jgi:hypothetical protein